MALLYLHELKDTDLLLAIGDDLFLRLNQEICEEKKLFFMGVEKLLLHLHICFEKWTLILSEIPEKCSFGQGKNKNGQ